MSAEVVAAEHRVLHVGHSILGVDVVLLVVESYDSCGISTDVGVAGSREGTHHATAMKVEGRVALHLSGISSGVCLVYVEVGMLGRHYQVYVEVDFSVTLYHTHFTATVGEQYAGAVGEVDLCVALHYREVTISGTIYCHGTAIHILGCSAQHLSLLGIHVGVYECLVDVDDSASLDVSAVEASAIDVGIHEGAVCFDLVVEGLVAYRVSHVPYEVPVLHEESVIFQVYLHGLEIGIHVEHHLHVIHVAHSLGTFADDTAVVCCVVYYVVLSPLGHAGVVASAH